jgi:hypothetical protein
VSIFPDVGPERKLVATPISSHKILFARGHGLYQTVQSESSPIDRQLMQVTDGHLSFSFDWQFRFLPGVKTAD